MATKLASLLVDLQLNSASLREGLDAAKAKITSFSSGITSALQGVEKMAVSVKRASREISQAGLGLAGVAAGAVALAATVDKGIAAEVKNLKMAFADLAVPIARLVVPAMRDLGAGVRQVADWVAGLSPQTKSMIATFIQVSAAAGAAALVISKVAAAVGALAGVIAAIVSGPFILAVAGIAAIAAGALLLHKAWRENWSGIQEKTKSVIETIAGYWASFKVYLGGIWDGLIDGYGRVMKFALNSTVQLLEALGKVSKEQASLQIWANNKGVDVTTNALKNGAIKTAALDLGKTIKDGALSGIDALKKEFQQLIGGIGNAGQATRHGGTLGPIVSGAKGMSMGTSLDSLNPEATAAEMGDRMRENTAFLSRGLKIAHLERVRVEKEYQGSLSQTLDRIGNGMKNAAGIIVSRMGMVGEIIGSAVQGFQSGGPWGALIAVIFDMVSRLKGFTDFIGMLNQKTFASLEKLNTALAPIWTILGQLSEALNPVRQIIHSVIGLVLNLLKPAFTIVGSLLQGIGKILEPIAQALSSVFAALSSVTDLLNNMEPITRSLGGTFKVVGAAINFAMMGVVASAGFIVKGIRDIAKSLGANTTDLDKAVTDLAMTWVRMAGKQKEFDLFDDVGSRIETTLKPIEKLGIEAGKTADKFGEMLHNLPAGYKGLAAARFIADNGGNPTGNGDDPFAQSGKAGGESSIAAAQQAVLQAQAALALATPANIAAANEALAAAVTALQRAIEQAERDRLADENDPYRYEQPSSSSSAATAAIIAAASGGGGIRQLSDSTGGVHIQNVNLYPRSFTEFVAQVSEEQERQEGTRRRNPHKSKR